MKREQLAVVNVTTRDFTKTPVRATITLKRSFCSCWPGLTWSSSVASFVFEDAHRSLDTHTSRASLINTSMLVRHKDQHTAKVQITVLGRGEEKMKVKFDLDTFINELYTFGLIQVGREVILRLLPTESEKILIKEQDHFQEENEERQEGYEETPNTTTNNVQVSSEDTLHLLHSSDNNRGKKKRRRKRCRRKKDSETSNLDLINESQNETVECSQSIQDKKSNTLQLLHSSDNINEDVSQETKNSMKRKRCRRRRKSTSVLHPNNESQNERAECS